MFGMSNTVFAIVVLIIVVVIGFRERIWSFISEWNDKRKASKKLDEMYQRLDRNAEGRYDHKAYLKKVDAQKKAQIKKNREKQEDTK
jgi:Sec-independent protein translocase protein TatA